MKPGEQIKEGMSADCAVIYEFRKLRKVFTFIATSKVAMEVKTFRNFLNS